MAIADLQVPICTTGAALLLVFSLVAVAVNGVLLIVLYKDPLKCFRKPISVYIIALALLDFLSGSVAGPGVMHNYIMCIMGKEDSPGLERTIFSGILAEFTICAANFLVLAMSFERLFAVALPIVYRQRTTVRKSLICVGCVMLYTLTVSLSGLFGTGWRTSPLHIHMNVTLPFFALIAVNIALLYAIRRHSRKTQYMLQSSDGSSSCNNESKRQQREKALACATQLVVLSFVMALFPYGVFLVMGRYNPQLQDQDWFFACQRFFMPFVLLNPAMNPFIFNFRLEHFHRAFKLVFCVRSTGFQSIQLTTIRNVDCEDRVVIVNGISSPAEETEEEVTR